MYAPGGCKRQGGDGKGKSFTMPLSVGPTKRTSGGTPLGGQGPSPAAEGARPPRRWGRGGARSRWPEEGKRGDNAMRKLGAAGILDRGGESIPNVSRTVTWTAPGFRYGAEDVRSGWMQATWRRREGEEGDHAMQCGPHKASRGSRPLGGPGPPSPSAVCPFHLRAQRDSEHPATWHTHLRLRPHPVLGLVVAQVGSA